MDRRRGSPPPRGDDRRYYDDDQGYGGPDRYRRRSRSPRDRRGSPPPAKRFRRDDDYPDERYGGRRRAPKTFREFMAGLPDSVTPDDAKARYDHYLKSFYGDELRADFEKRKSDPVLRRQYDPRQIAVAIEARNHAVREASVKFHEDEAAGKGVGDDGPPGPAGFAPPPDAAPAAAAAAEPEAPAVTLEEDVVAGDLALARKLVRALDAERGVTDNPLAPPVVPGAAENEGEQPTEAPEEQGPSLEERRAAQEEADAAADAGRSYDDKCAALDALLQYLWVVHGIDYYAGKEFGGPEDGSRVHARLTMRPEPSEAANGGAEGDNAAVAGAGAGEGEKAAAAAGEGAEGAEKPAVAVVSKEGEEASAVAAPSAVDKAPASTAVDAKERARKQYENRVVQRWRTRLEKGDPLAALCQKDRVERDIEAFVDAQIIQHDDKKWANKLSQKMFVAREFVVKHIRNKHGHVLDAERERILDSIYFENFKSAKEEEQRRHGHDGGRGRGRGRGRGGRGGMHHGPIMMVDPSMMMGAPILVPAGGGMAPMIMAGPMDMMSMGSGGGGRGGRGRGGRGGRGGGRYGQPPMVISPAGAGPGYFDLDAPKNNRAVLDYGDL